MNYIVLDLEWNQSADGKICSNNRIPFEIIQIGAVKLDENFNEICQFDRYVRPAVYLKLHKKVEELLNVTIEELSEVGYDFCEVAHDFLEWCGEDYIFCTWGQTDLTELQRNLDYYKIDYNFPMPFLFYDLQKLYSLCFQDGKSRITLKHAIEALGMDELWGYHSAGSDARYTAQLLKQLDFERVKGFYSVDTHVIPQNKKQEIYLDFGNYQKYISRGFPDREAAASDREVRACRCFKCGKPMKRLIKWFSTNNKSNYGLFLCQEHGMIKGRFRIKSTDDGIYYAVRIFKFTDEDGAKKIKQRQQKEKEHRRIIRKKESQL